MIIALFIQKFSHHVYIHDVIVVKAFMYLTLPVHPHGGNEFTYMHHEDTRWLFPDILWPIFTLKIGQGPLG